MSSRKNTWREKRTVDFYDGHNRTAGVSAGNRAKSNQKRRRNGKALAKNIVRGYVPNVFSK